MAVTNPASEGLGSHVQSRVCMQKAISAANQPKVIKFLTFFRYEKRSKIWRQYTIKKYGSAIN